LRTERITVSEGREEVLSAAFIRHRKSGTAEHAKDYRKGPEERPKAE
jgi:hypothetical protein